MFVFSVCCLVSRQRHIISPIARSNDSSVLASSLLTLSPSALLPLTRLKSLQGGADTPLAYKILCVRSTSVVHDGFSIPTKASLSATGVTLDTGGWLALTRPGLAPGKKRQASLGALASSSQAQVWEQAATLSRCIYALATGRWSVRAAFPRWSVRTREADNAGARTPRLG